MADFVQGDWVRDYFTIVDSDNIPIQGVNVVNGATEDPDGESFVLDISEVGSGVYKVQFLADKVGTWYYRVDTVGLTPEQSWEETFNIGPFSLYGAAIGTAATGPTLDDLVKSVATRNGDFLEVRATANGASDGTSFVDSIRLSAIPSQSLQGANLTIVSPIDSDNYRAETRVIDFDEDSSVMVLQPALPVIAQAGQVGQLTNLYSVGAWRTQYIDAINEAIDAAYPGHLIDVEYSYPSLWNQEDPWITLPTHLTRVYGVRVDDGVNMPWLIPMSSQNISTIAGWYFDFSRRQLGIAGNYNQLTHGGTVTVLGYGRPAHLEDGTDRTTVDREWITLYASNVIKMMKGDQRQLSVASMFENSANIMRPKTITGMHPDTIAVQ